MAGEPAAPPLTSGIGKAGPLAGVLAGALFCVCVVPPCFSRMVCPTPALRVEAVEEN